MRLNGGILLNMSQIQVKVLRPFPSVETKNRMAEVGQILSVSENQFWLRRLEQKDCEIYQGAVKASVAEVAKEKKEGVSKK